MVAPVRGTHRLLPYVLVCSTLAVVGVLYEESLVVPSLLLASVAVLMRHYASLAAAALSRLSVEARVEAATEGSDVRVGFELRNPTRVPVILGEYSLSYSPLLRLRGPSKAGLLVVPPSGAVEITFTFGGRVGRYRVGPLRVVARDPLGLFRSVEVEVCGPLEVRVLPTVEPVSVRRLWVPTRRSGLVGTRHPGTGTVLYDVREYGPGDELRSVVWRLLASRGLLAVKEMERETYQHVVFVVDSTRDMWVGPPGRTPAEHFSRIAASVSYYLCARGYSVSALVFSEREVFSSGRPSWGREGFRRVIGALSNLEYVEDSGRGVDFGRVLSGLLSLLPRERAVVFLLTRPAGLREELAARLSEVLGSRGHVLFLVTPLLPSYEVADAPPWVRSLYRLKLYGVLKEDLESVGRLGRRGVRVVAVDPTYAPQRLVRIVEELL